MTASPLPSRRRAAPRPIEIAARRPLPDLYALQVFVTVCEADSMAAAAQRLGITQSAVSQTIKTLEREAGVLLLDRDVRPARPTRAGQALLAMAEPLLSQARQVFERLRQGSDHEHSTIRLGCVDSFAATLGPALIRALSGRSRQLQLWSGLTPGLNGQLLSRELDLAVCTEAPDDERIASATLFTEAWAAVFPAGIEPPTVDGHLDLARLAADAPMTLPLIRYSRRSVIGRQIDRFLRHVGLEPPRRFEFDATDPMLSLVAAGHGWALSTPLCLWQSRAWLPEVRVLPVPPRRLGLRDLLVLHRRDEGRALVDEIVASTHAALRGQILPMLRRAMPDLPPQAIELVNESAASIAAARGESR
ncbi:MAG: LysR family transcriptional regulator [Burkholderiaceae bacterium]